MSTVPDDRDLPDEVPTEDYLEQQTTVDPDADLAEDDDLSAGAVETSRVETALSTDVEADEADLLEQAARVPPEDEELAEND